MAEMFPVTGHYLRPDAEIVHSPVFESAVVKVSRASSRGSRAWTRARSAEDFATVLLQSRPAPDQTNLSMVQLKDNTIIHFFIVMSEHWLSLRSSLSRL
ncbi:hypothetical protein PC128_g9454 [Phytophthora cactorum]|nr:hypothetical protein PC128_g9454 [Phytophthora cactorum]